MMWSVSLDVWNHLSWRSLFYCDAGAAFVAMETIVLSDTYMNLWDKINISMHNVFGQSDIHGLFISTPDEAFFHTYKKNWEVFDAM